ARSRSAFRDQAARGHHRSRHRAAGPADPVHGRRQLLTCTSCALAGGIESLSGPRRRLASAGSGSPRERGAMTLNRRLLVFLMAGRGPAAVPAASSMPHWQQTVAAVSKGGRRGGPPASEPVPVLATAARAADVPVYLDGVGTAKALNTVTVRSQV